MREFLGSGRQLRSDHFEHGKKDKGARSQKPEGFLPQMDTDFHRWENENYLCFICVNLWLQLVFALGVK